MKKMRTLLALILTALFLIMPTNTASAFTITPNIPIIPNMPDVFFSAHSAIKAVPIYRVSKTWIHRHAYTVNEEEYNYWKSLSKINDDGRAGYISPVPLPFTVPMWDMNNGDQYFATSQTSHDDVMGKYGYTDDGIMGYVVPLNDTAHGNSIMYQWYKGDTDPSDYNFTKDSDHYYNWVPASIPGYTYEGAQFRHWTEGSVLQEVYITSPKGGETLAGESNVNITWNTKEPGGNISLYYTLNPSDGWAIIAENIGNTGSYTWKVPNSETNKAIVEARWTYEGIDANCYDQSDNYFNIKSSGGTSHDWMLLFKPIAINMLLKPAAPTNLAVSSQIFQKNPALFWKDNANNETGFIIERKNTGGSYTQLAQVAANSKKYVDTSAVSGKAYSYRIKAINGSLYSAYSNQAGCTAYSSSLPDLFYPLNEEEKPSNLGTSGEVTMVFTVNSTSYMVNNVAKTMDTSPIILEGRTLIPIRFAADPIGAVPAWDKVERKVTVTLGKTKIELWIGSNTAIVNGKSEMIDPKNPDVKPLLINDRTMLPLRYVTEKLGCDLEWIEKIGQITVIYPGDKLDPQPEPPSK